MSMPPTPPPPDGPDGPDGPARPELPPLVRLDRFLEQPDPDVRYRIDQLWPAAGRVLFAAQYKAGKTTAVGNLLRSLVDGDPFLGRYEVDPPAGPVVLVDDELHESTLRRWLRGQGIVRTDRVHLVALRGRVSTFDIMSDRTRDAWARQLADVGASVVVLDCLRPILDAHGLSEDKDTGKVLGAFDELLGAAGADEATVVHHMGHHGERSRGDSRLRDWPDAEWRLVRDGDQPSDPRYFAAYGRDVDVAEQRVDLDGERRLVVTGGSRRDQHAEVALSAVLDLLGSVPDLSGRAIEQRLADTDHSRDAIRRGVALGVADGRIVTHEGPRRAVLHRVSAPVRGSAPSVRRRTADECASAPIGGRTAHSVPAAASAPTDGTTPAPDTPDTTDTPPAGREGPTCAGCGAPATAHAPDGRAYCARCVPWREAGAA
jgi:hypothetical protein